MQDQVTNEAIIMSLTLMPGTMTEVSFEVQDLHNSSHGAWNPASLPTTVTITAIIKACEPMLAFL